MNHPRFLAFEYTWIPAFTRVGDSSLERFSTVNAYDLADFRRQVQGQSDVLLLAVHHVSAEDGFMLTDLVWEKPDHDEFPCSYCDQLARESWARQS